MIGVVQFHNWMTIRLHGSTVCSLRLLRQVLVLVSLPGGGKLVPLLAAPWGADVLQNLRQRQRKSLKKRDMIPGWCQLRRSCLEDLVGQLVLGLSQENMGLRGRCMNKQTIQSTHGLQHLMIQTAEYCSKNLIYADRGRFPSARTYCIHHNCWAETTYDDRSTHVSSRSL